METLPKDIRRLLLLKYVNPLDFPNVLQTGKLFHVLTNDEKEYLYKRDYFHREYQRKCESEASRSGQDIKHALKHYYQCDRCYKFLKKKNEKKHKCSPYVELQKRRDFTVMNTELQNVDGIYLYEKDIPKTQCHCKVKYYPWQKHHLKCQVCEQFYKPLDGH